MGVHKREREMSELKEHYIKKSSAILLVVVAVLVGAFLGNAITMVYMGKQQQRASVGQQQAPAPQQNSGQHEANPVALANLEKAAQSDPTNVAKWVELGNFCFDHQLYAKAATAYERAVELKPMQPNVWSDLGVMYRRTQRYEKAIEAFGHAAALDTTHITARFNMGIVYLHDLNDKASAIKMWKQALAINPDAKSPNGQSLKSMIQDLERQ